MDRLRMQTKNIADENYEKLAKLFPNAVTETIDENGQVVRAIDKDVLMQEINTTVVDDKDQRYQFTWPDKNKSIIMANSPINKTLRPCREESVDFDNTENLYIEGDNLEVLKLLRETYLGQIKMIYIDPPYNTGNDFVYEDDFKQTTENYMGNSCQYDEEGNRLVKNLDSNGRFHTDWLNMIYPRLKIAKNLLKENGAIFISIDDHEQENLKKCCDEVFGSYNFVGEVIRKTKSMTADNGCGFNLQHEVLIIYAKDINKFYLNGEMKNYNNYSNPDNDPNGDWCSGDPSAKSGGHSTYFEIKNPYTNRIDFPPKGRYWAFSKESLRNYIKEGKVKFKEIYRENERGFIFKRYKKDATSLYEPVHSLFGVDNSYMNQVATIEVKNLFNNNVFSYPKPVPYIHKIVQYTTNKDDIVLDFFSGSATTAHAVMKLNAEDGGNRKFIMVQLPEKTDEKSEAFKAGYKNICEIGKERIRRASKKIAEENPDAKFDGGFRVLKCDNSNMKDVFYYPDEYNEPLFSSLVNNIKDDRTPEDLLFQTMLDLGILLSSKIEETTIAGKRVFTVNRSDDFDSNADLIACFDDNVTDEVITEIAKKQPTYFVMRDSSMADDSVATNFEQIFSTYSPITTRKVL